MANSSLTINFTTTTGSVDQFIDIDLDDDLNNEKSTFLFGDTAYFRVFTNCSTLSFYPSESSVSSNGTKTADSEEYISFTQPPATAGGIASENTASVSYPINSGTLTATKIAGDCGSLSVDAVDTKQINASKAGVAVYKVEYESDYKSYSIGGISAPPGWVDDSTYPVVIVVVGS